MKSIRLDDLDKGKMIPIDGDAKAIIFYLNKNVEYSEVRKLARQIYEELKIPIWMISDNIIDAIIIDENDTGVSKVK